VIFIGRKKKSKPKGKAKSTFICQHCGKMLKTERGLTGHEKKCGAGAELDGAAVLASETKKILEITEGEPDSGEIKEELAHELERLKAEFKRQKEEEMRLESERSELAKERDELYKDMTRSKSGPASAILDPFGDSDKGAALPEITVPAESGKADEAELSVKVEPLPPAAPPRPRKPKSKPGTKARSGDIDITEKTAELRKKLMGTNDEPEAESREQVADEPSKSIIPADSGFDEFKQRAISDMDHKIATLEGLLTELRNQVPNRGELELKLQKRVSKPELDVIIEGLRKDMGKIDNKVIEMAEEVGYGESLNVSKIPASILESVYEATLEDAVKAVIQNIGPYDAETLILKVLEDIRTQTSGSELFKYSEGKLKIMNLTRALESKAISAKQIQATYSELLKKILDFAPGYKSKNFRAMLKIKSQEFAIDKTSGLTEVLTEIRSEIDNFRQLRSDVDERLTELEESRNELMSDVRDLWEKLNDMEIELTATPAEPAAAEPAEAVEESHNADGAETDTEEEAETEDEDKKDNKTKGFKSAVLE
jgi:hypothetical protein